MRLTPCAFGAYYSTYLRQSGHAPQCSSFFVLLLYCVDQEDDASSERFVSRLSDRHLIPCLSWSERLLSFSSKVVQIEYVFPTHVL